MKTNRQKEKGPLRLWIENLWYYYKWAILGGAIAILVLAITIPNLPKTEKASYDAKIQAVFARPLTMQEFSFQDRLESVIEDIDGDGDVRIVTDGIYITESGDNTNDVVSIGQLESVLAYAQADLVLLDGGNLAKYKGKDFLIPLEQYVDLSRFEPEDLAYRNGVAIAVRLSDSKVLTDMQFIIDDVYAGIMFVPENASEQTLKTRQNAVNMLMELTKKISE